MTTAPVRKYNVGHRPAKPLPPTREQQAAARLADLRAGAAAEAVALVEVDEFAAFEVLLLFVLRRGDGAWLESRGTSQHRLAIAVGVMAGELTAMQAMIAGAQPVTTVSNGSQARVTAADGESAGDAG